MIGFIIHVMNMGGAKETVSPHVLSTPSTQPSCHQYLAVQDAGETCSSRVRHFVQNDFWEKEGAEISGIRPKLHFAPDKLSCDRQKLCTKTRSTFKICMKIRMRDWSDLAARLEEARQRLPLKRLMESRGRGPANGNWKSFPQCPYCGGAQCAGVFDGAHGDFFKCHRTSCRSGTADERAAWDEIGFLAFELNLDRRRATRAWLQEAGLWDEKPAGADGKPAANGEDQSPSSADGSSSKPALLAFYERSSLKGG